MLEMVQAATEVCHDPRMECVGAEEDARPWCGTFSITVRADSKDHAIEVVHALGTCALEHLDKP